MFPVTAEPSNLNMCVYVRVYVRNVYVCLCVVGMSSFEFSVRIYDSTVTGNCHTGVIFFFTLYRHTIILIMFLYLADLGDTISNIVHIQKI